MAIFVFIAWSIQLGEKLGLLETESSDPQHMAYRRCHNGLELLREHLPDNAEVEVHDHSLRWSDTLFILDGSKLHCNHHTVDLGPHGSARFWWADPGRLAVRFYAIEQGKEHRLTVRLAARQKKDTGERAAAGVPGSGDDARRARGLFTPRA